jgi:hypothetical protein
MLGIVFFLPIAAVLGNLVCLRAFDATFHGPRAYVVEIAREAHLFIFYRVQE